MSGDLVCAVPLCPVVPKPGESTCELHQQARLARSLGIAEDATGKGAKRCLTCKRPFKRDDYVQRQMKKRAQAGRTPGAPYGWVHVACEPPTPRLSRKAIRASVKPLLVLDDAS